MTTTLNRPIDVEPIDHHRRPAPMVTVARGRADHRSRALHGIARQPRRDDGTSVIRVTSRGSRASSGRSTPTLTFAVYLTAAAVGERFGRAEHS